MRPYSGYSQRRLFLGGHKLHAASLNGFDLLVIMQQVQALAGQRRIIHLPLSISLICSLVVLLDLFSDK